jgi:hypothetical protein
VKSLTLPGFWECYEELDQEIKVAAKKAFRLWAQNPFHPSLRFKCIHRDHNVWAVRVTHSFRALGLFDDDTVTWFWIGNHDDYMRLIG